MVERILELIRSMNISNGQFADEIGIQRSSISHLISGRNNPSLEIVQKILSKFPEVSTEWLLTGKGDMYRGKQPESLNDDQPHLFHQQIIENQEDNKQLQSYLQSEIPQEHVINTKPAEVKKTPVRKTGGNDKDVEKIVWFYKDKTFREYYPND